MFQDIFRGKSKQSGLFLGAPEAEGEASENSRMPLAEAYHDYHGIAGQLSGEKFILIGRKGSGKSAFAEYVVGESKANANLFAKFIRKTDFALESVVQARSPNGEPIDAPAFVRWLIYVNLIKLFLQSEAAKADSAFGLLQQFLNKNSGFVDIKSYEIKELINSHGFDVSVEYFKRFMRSRYHRDIQIKSERAPFYKLIPHLEEVLVSILSSTLERQNKNSYVLFFDDLDLDYLPSNAAAKSLIVDILRVAKEINNDIFGKNGLGAKVVVLLRDDLVSEISGAYAADTAKIFATYGVRISWYQDGFLQGIIEDDLFLKAFINNRIQIAYQKSGREFLAGSPWDWIVKFDPKGKSTFKDVVNNTLFRPRDILLYFLPIQNNYFDLPLGWHENVSLMHSYSDLLADELKNEMSAIYSPEQIVMIFRSLSRINKDSSCSFGAAEKYIAAEVTGVDKSELLQYLIDRSLVGCRDPKNGWLTFSCRTRIDAPIASHSNVLSDQEIVVQYGVRDYVLRKY